MGTDENLIKKLKALNNVREDWRITEVYNILYREQIWYQAYQNIYSNHGAFTKGVNDDTLDNFDKERISKIINSLKNKTYTPTPVRRVLIPKANGKTRPLGIPTGTDKLVQEVCRIILESIYEPKFSNLSHGFRPNRSCHTALKEVYTWTFNKWFIEFDIKGCFDNINHEILLNVLKKRIDDTRFISLIKSFLEAGYLENWKYNETYSGTPQGGIISPILTNIYLNELDTYVENKCNIINSKPNERKQTPEYRKLLNDYHNAKINIKSQLKQIRYIEDYINSNVKPKFDNNHPIWNVFVDSFKINDQYNGQKNRWHKLKTFFNMYSWKYDLNLSELIKCARYQELKDKYNYFDNIIRTYPNIIRSTKSTDNSKGLERLRYVRYADDFVLGYIGTKENARIIYQDIIDFIKTNLKLDISTEKSGIRDQDGIEFLGYEISMPGYTSERITTIDGINKRRYLGKPKFKIPTSRAIRFVKDHDYGVYVENKSVHRPYLLNYDDYEIINQYNAELRGLMNYYKYAINAKDTINRVQWLCHYSLLKTLANKHKCSVAKLFKNKIINVKKHPRIGKIWYYIIQDKKIEVFNIKDIECKSIYDLDPTNKCNDNRNIRTISIRNSAVKKLIANECEICGKDSKDVKIVLHHWNPIRKHSKN